MAGESWDPVWEGIFKAREWGKYPSEDLIRFVARNFYGTEDRKAIKILEVGCGPGANVWYLAREGFSAYGIDGSETAVQRATARLNTEVPGWSGEIRVGDIRELPYPDGVFDAVLDHEAIYANSWEASQQIVREIHRVLKPQGKFFSRTFASGSLGDGIGEKIGHNAWNVSEGGLAGKGFSRFTSRNEIKELFRGFRVDEVNLMDRTTGGIDSGKSIKEWLIWATRLDI